MKPFGGTIQRIFQSVSKQPIKMLDPIKRGLHSARKLGSTAIFKKSPRFKNRKPF